MIKADDYVLVPRDPTQAMMNALYSGDPAWCKQTWRAILEAAPDLRVDDAEAGALYAHLKGTPHYEVMRRLATSGRYPDPPPLDGNDAPAELTGKSRQVALDRYGEPFDRDHMEIPARDELRDHFAGLAMQADASQVLPADVTDFSIEQRAEWAYRQADAMLAARTGAKR